MKPELEAKSSITDNDRVEKSSQCTERIDLITGRKEGKGKSLG